MKTILDLLLITAAISFHAPAAETSGPERYVANKAFIRISLPAGGQSWLRLAKAQHPSAIILGCADSRVPPEVVFDQRLGDLFVVRVAGNIATDEVFGSIEYAVEHLGASVVSRN